MDLDSTYHPRTFSVFPTRTSDLRPLPILVVERQGRPEVCWEAVTFLQAQAVRGHSYSRMKAAAYTLGMLHEFVQLVYGEVPIPEESLPMLIRAFLIARRTGQGPDGQQLGWTPVQAARNRRDRAYVREFSAFCAQEFGHFPLVPTESQVSLLPVSRTYQDVLAELKQSERDLLSHLARHRHRPEPMAVGVPDRTIARSPGTRATIHPPRYLVEEMIQGTKSIVQQMLLIELSFGGPRLSEALHHWRCDVLPGTFRALLFWGDASSEIPLLILAHPQQASYLGQVRPGRMDRTQWLAKQYRLLPRTLLEGDPLWAGWKGMMVENSPLGISQVYWADPQWGIRYYGLFKKLRDEIWPRVPDAIRTSHPYLYINDDETNAEFGLPLKRSNAEKAIARAMDRVGVPARYRRGSHGLRHSYVAMLRTLGLTPEQIRICLHQLSVLSNEDYGRESARLNRCLQEAATKIWAGK